MLHWNLLLVISSVTYSCFAAGSLPALLSPAITGGTESCNKSTANFELLGVRTTVQDQVTPYLNGRYGTECGSPGWTRVFDLDMSIPGAVCPSGWALLTNTVRGCGRQGDNNVASTTVSVRGRTYSEVCGRITAIQKGRTDGFGPFTDGPSLNGRYVDGVALTHGSSPRTHIWTFVSGLSQVPSSDNDERIYCPSLVDLYPPFVPDFVGNNYFCDSGRISSTGSTAEFYTSRPLWDGQDCIASASTICRFNNPPYFYATLPEPTTDDLDMRVLVNEDASNENVIVIEVELYVQ